MKRSVMIFAVLCLAAPLALADAPRVGVVTGKVLDPAGEGLPGATIQLISDRGTESEVSGADGVFRFAFVIPGPYTVRADLAGFQSAEGEIVVTAGGRADVRLQLAEVAGDEIVVTGEAPLVNKFDVTGGGAVDAKELEDIVVPQRWHQAVLDYFPGVSHSMEGGQGAMDVEGNTLWRVNHYIDGVDTSEVRTGGTSSVRLPNVAVGQIQLSSSRADAEFSRTMGSVTTTVVKSGTNQFRGTVSATFQNLAWNESLDIFPEELPDDLDMRWEAAIGGPILRDKLWFFASAADMGWLSYAVLPSGERIDTVTTLKPWVAKVDFRPSAAHSLSVTASETPTTFYYVAMAWDRYAAADFLQGGNFATMRWSWAISDDLLLDTALAYQKTYDDRDWLDQHPNDPNAPPWSPLGHNDVLYYDAATGGWYNAISISLGPGSIEYPRYQGNVSLNWFKGDHDVKFGLDYQDTRWLVDSKAQPMAIGVGYNPNLPGGFVRPLYLRYFVGPSDVGGVENSSQTWGLFARDRLTVGDHWTFNLGLRLDQQTHWNDDKAEIFSFANLAPRLTAVYDVRGDGQLLVTGGYGRYYDWIPMGLTQAFNVVPQGRTDYDQYLWVAAQQAYSYFLGHVSGVASIADNTIEPAYKDEYTAGLEWAFSDNWAFKANALYYRETGQYSQEEQFLDDGSIGAVYENIPDAYQRRESLSLEVRRRFRDNWSLNASYTWSSTEGNCYNVWNIWCHHRFGQLRDLDLTAANGQPLSVVNRDGRLFNDLPNMFKVRGNYLFRLGRGHSINVGGLARYQSGRRWQLITEHTDVAETYDVIEYLEPAGSRALEESFQLDLNASWRFPISGRFSGAFTIEVGNATNEQTQLTVSEAAMRTGDSTAGVTSGMIQTPRYFRALASLSF